MARDRTSLIGLCVALYVCVLVGSSVCADPSDVFSRGHEHHSHNASHVSLCAWACQGSAESAFVPAPPSVEFFNPASAIVPAVHDSLSAHDLIARPSRGPPL